MRLLVSIAIVFALLCAGTASAATRYAAPGGVGADPCADPSAPCSLYTAADSGAPGTTIQSGDVVEMAPGTYSEAAGDLGAAKFVQPPAGVIVRGAEGGESRPLIRLEANGGFWGAFFVGTDAAVAGVEIVNEGAGAGAALTLLSGGSAARSVVRSTASSSITCAVSEGTIRDTACLNEAGGVALGVSTSTFTGTHSVTLRNVTAIGTGSGSVGVEFGYFGSAPGVVAVINGKAVLAKGEAKDVRARGMSLSGAPGTGASTTITLDHSRYATADTATSGGGSASVTAPGTNDNITAEPLLASDGYHQLAGSPTIDKGAVDGFSGGTDLDGQLRSIGVAPDIGADELANGTATTVACAPSSLTLGGSPGSASCLVTVIDTAGTPTVPTGAVALSASGGSLGGACALAAASGSASTCTVGYSPLAAGSQTVTATYGGDLSHSGSAGTGTIGVSPAPAADPGKAPASKGKGSAGKNGLAPATRLGKHPPKRTEKRLAKFTFSANQRGSSFRCKLDRRPFKNCRSPFKRTLNPGPHVFKVRAVNSQGEPDRTPAVFRWTILAG